MNMKHKEILYIPKQKWVDFSFPAHTLTWAQDLEPLKQSLLPEDVPLFLSIYEKALGSPKKAKKEGELFLEKYPVHPVVLNLLSFIYISLKKVKKAKKLIECNYELNPENIFAKINYAHHCLDKKKFEKIPEIFQGKFSLQDLYPERKTFHISEFRGFVLLMGYYFLSIDKRALAIHYHYLAKRLDKNHPSTLLLQKKIYYIPIHKKIVSALNSVLFYSSSNRKKEQIS